MVFGINIAYNTVGDTVLNCMSLISVIFCHNADKIV